VVPLYPVLVDLWRTLSRIPALGVLTALTTLAATPPRTVVVLGDSLSAARPGSLCWPVELARQIAASGRVGPGVVNRAISGNRLLRHGYGPSGLSRLERDVLGESGLAAVVLLLGTNDISYSQLRAEDLPGIDRSPASAADLAAGYQEVARRVREAGARAVGATLPPFGGAPTWSPAAEAKRQALNFWIRESNLLDAVLDFDAVLRDPAEPTRLLPGFDSGDHVHPSDAGQAAMAAAVNPSLLLERG
jgi:lysophospholipase L1-like esterase